MAGHDRVTGGDKVRCPRCHGAGYWEEPGDLHRSAGIVPCRECDGSGWITVEVIDTDARPKWDIKDIPEDLARWLVGHSVVRIELRWEQTGVDTGTEWLELTANDESMVKVSTGFFEIQSLARLQVDRRGLVRLDPRIGLRIGEIDKWDRRHSSERATYERLKRKFGDE